MLFFKNIKIDSFELNDTFKNAFGFKNKKFYNERNEELFQMAKMENQYN